MQWGYSNILRKLFSHFYCFTSCKSLDILRFFLYLLQRRDAIDTPDRSGILWFFSFKKTKDTAHSRTTSDEIQQCCGSKTNRKIQKKCVYVYAPRIKKVQIALLWYCLNVLILAIETPFSYCESFVLQMA
jgi:hypothetical protein